MGAVIVGLTVVLCYFGLGAASPTRLPGVDAISIKPGVHTYPDLRNTPDRTFITHLGPELTQKIIDEEFSKIAISEVVKDLFKLVDSNNDGVLDRAELTDWLDRNHKINQAVEIKTTFLHCDDDKDGKVTFKEYYTRGTDILTSDTFASTFLTEDDKLSLDALGQAQEISKDGTVNLKRIIHENYKLFVLCDQNEDGGLDWNEFLMFSRPGDFAHTYTQVTGKHSMAFDENNDMRYDRDEFEAYFSYQVPLPNLLPEASRDPKELFVQCDKDNDGFLSYNEAQACIPQGFLFVNHENTEWLMLDADENEDGYLTEDEMIKAFDSLAQGDDYWNHDEL